MGMYTEVFFRAEVSAGAARVMERARSGLDGSWPDHPFFETPRFRHLFIADSAYFPGPGCFRITRAADDEYARYSAGAEDWAIVDFRHSLKNYDDEIELFFDWVRPHVRHGGGGGSRDFIGYSLYEEGEPILYFARGE